MVVEWVSCRDTRCNLGRYFHQARVFRTLVLALLLAALVYLVLCCTTGKRLNARNGHVGFNRVQCLLLLSFGVMFFPAEPAAYHTFETI